MIEPAAHEFVVERGKDWVRGIQSTQAYQKTMGELTKNGSELLSRNKRTWDAAANDHGYVSQNLSPSSWSTAIEGEIRVFLQRSSVDAGECAKEIIDNVYMNTSTICVKRAEDKSSQHDRSSASTLGGMMERELTESCMVTSMPRLNMETLQHRTFGNAMVGFFFLLCKEGLIIVKDKINSHTSFALVNKKRIQITGEIDFVGYDACSDSLVVLDSKFSSGQRSFSLTWAFQLFMYCFAIKNKLGLDYLPAAYILNYSVEDSSTALCKINFAYMIRILLPMLLENNALVFRSITQNITVRPRRINTAFLSHTKYMEPFYDFIVHQSNIRDIATTKSGLLSDIKGKINATMKTSGPFSFVLKLRASLSFDKKDTVVKHKGSSQFQWGLEIVQSVIEGLDPIETHFDGPAAGLALLNILLSYNLIPIRANVSVELQTPSMVVQKTHIICYDYNKQKFALVTCDICETSPSPAFLLALENSFLVAAWEQRLGLSYAPQHFVCQLFPITSKIILYEKHGIESRALSTVYNLLNKHSNRSVVLDFSFDMPKFPYSLSMRMSHSMGLIYHRFKLPESTVVKFDMTKKNIDDDMRSADEVFMDATLLFATLCKAGKLFLEDRMISEPEENEIKIDGTGRARIIIGQGVFSFDVVGKYSVMLMRVTDDDTNEESIAVASSSSVPELEEKMKVMTFPATKRYFCLDYFLEQITKYDEYTKEALFETNEEKRVMVDFDGASYNAMFDSLHRNLRQKEACPMVFKSIVTNNTFSYLEKIAYSFLTCAVLFYWVEKKQATKKEMTGGNFENTRTDFLVEYKNLPPALLAIKVNMTNLVNVRKNPGLYLFS
jgi:hypothetical protein